MGTKRPAETPKGSKKRRAMIGKGEVVEERQGNKFSAEGVLKLCKDLVKQCHQDPDKMKHRIWDDIVES